MKLRIATSAVLVTVLGALGCASTPTPTARLASSEAAVRAAQELNADSTPAAQLHLKLARDQLGEAKRLMADGKNGRAEYVLLRAESDAEVAIALAKETQTRKLAEGAIDQVRKARTSFQQSNEQNATPPPPPTNKVVPDSAVPPSIGR